MKKKGNKLMLTMSAALIASALVPTLSSAATKLAVKKVTFVNLKTVTVEFTGAVDSKTALKVANYKFTSGVTVSKVALSGNKATLFLKGAESKTTSFKSTLTVSNIKDKKGNAVTPFKTTVNFVVPSKPVVFTKAQTLDVNKNGKVDAVAVTLNQNVTGVDKTDFNVAGYKVTGASTKGSVATLTLEEQTPTIANVKPTVSLVGEIKDSSGKAVKSVKPVQASLGFLSVNLGGERFNFNPTQQFAVKIKLVDTFERPAGSQLRFKVEIKRDGKPVKNLPFNYVIDDSSTDENGVAYIPNNREIEDMYLSLFKIGDGFPVNFTLALKTPGLYDISVALVDHNKNDSLVDGASYQYSVTN
ncbi:hypothetical protein [Gottfriedia luciferensis]|uniref:hypothetical protein n=1 Tax=Gottfriedia luciferensis TaxID=178774 RepID=UPI000B4419B2|nr:hypothetical protein [Gottfriedia luciferensis]